MNTLTLDELEHYLDAEMVAFNKQRAKILQELAFEELFLCNPFVLGIWEFVDLVKILDQLLDHTLLHREEKLLDEILVRLAIFVVAKSFGGYKSSIPGIDFEFSNNGIQYLVAVKPNLNEETTPEDHEPGDSLRNAVIQRSKWSEGEVRAVLGVCYGKSETSQLQGYTKVVGKDFWRLISGNERLYLDIVNPLIRKSRDHDEIFISEKVGVTHRFFKLFYDLFCTERGLIDWEKFVEFNLRDRHQDAIQLEIQGVSL